MPQPVWTGTVLMVEGRQGEFCLSLFLSLLPFGRHLLELGCSSSPAVGHLDSKFSSLRTLGHVPVASPILGPSALGREDCTICSQSTWALGLRPSQATSILGSPVRRCHENFQLSIFMLDPLSPIYTQMPSFIHHNACFTHPHRCCFEL